jgi:putative ABC transport system ATP-binding protein
MPQPTPPSESAPLIEITALSRVYNLETTPVYALRDISLTIMDGSFVSIVGKSGSGKSTLLNLMAGMDKPSSGDIIVGGNAVTAMNAKQLALYRRDMVGMVFQSFNLIPTMTAADNVALPLFFAGVSEKARTEKAVALLTSVGLAARANHRPTELSGGEQQRVAIARALISNPLFLLADEPTGNLDTATTADILALLKTLNREQGKTIVMITHDLDLAAEMSTRIITLKDGSVLRDEPVEALVK